MTGIRPHLLRALLGVATVPAMAGVHAAPPGGVIEARLTRYDESQPGLKREAVTTPTLRAVVPIGQQWRIDATLNGDWSTSKRPAYHTEATSVVSMTDRRRGLDLRATRTLSGNLSVTGGALVAGSRDAQTRGLMASGRFVDADNNVTYTGGISIVRDSIDSANGVADGERRTTVAALAGMSVVLANAGTVETTLSYARGKGYYGNPYMALDNRPRELEQIGVQLRYNHPLPEQRAVARVGLRVAKNSFSVRSETVDLEYEKALASGWSVAPNLRYYEQTKADFYYDPNYSSTLLAPFPVGFVVGQSPITTSDPRMSAFGAVSVGLKASRTFMDHWQFDVRVDHSQQRGNWKLLGGKGSPGLDPIRSNLIQVGVSKKL